MPHSRGPDGRDAGVAGDADHAGHAVAGAAGDPPARALSDFAPAPAEPGAGAGASGGASGGTGLGARIGVFGGTFDPPHVGHLLVATDAMERLALDRVLFVPAATQPLKGGATRTAAEHRLAMVRALVGDDRRFAVDSIEIDRGGVSFTVETLGTLAARWPGARLFLLAGADVLTTFALWRDPDRIRALATLVVLTREADGGVPVVAPPGFPGGPPTFLPTRRVDVSSTEIRARMAAGRSIRGFVPESVAALIRTAGLYR